MAIFCKKSEESPPYGDFHCLSFFFRETLHFFRLNILCINGISEINTTLTLHKHCTDTTY